MAPRKSRKAKSRKPRKSAKRSRRSTKAKRKPAKRSRRSVKRKRKSVKRRSVKRKSTRRSPKVNIYLGRRKQCDYDFECPGNSYCDPWDNTCTAARYSRPVYLDPYDRYNRYHLTLGKSESKRADPVPSAPRYVPTPSAPAVTNNSKRGNVIGKGCSHDSECNAGMKCHGSQEKKNRGQGYCLF